LEWLALSFLVWQQVAHGTSHHRSLPEARRPSWNDRNPFQLNGLQSELEQHCQNPYSRHTQSRKEDGEHRLAGDTWLKRIDQAKFRITPDTMLSIFLSRHMVPINAHTELLAALLAMMASIRLPQPLLNW
jgi:hypothetical protein